MPGQGDERPCGGALPQSLGLYYAMMTQHHGFDYGEDEYKVMGLSSYGQPTHDLSPLLRANGGGYEFNTAMLRRTSVPGEPPLSPRSRSSARRSLGSSGSPASRGAQFGKAEEDFAASAEKHLETVIVSMARHYHKETGLRRLCIAGGVAMNCVVNQRLAAMPEFEAVSYPCRRRQRHRPRRGPGAGAPGG